MKFTTQKQVRESFWANHPDLSRKKIRNYAGSGLMYTTDTRCAFVDFVDHLQRSGAITESLAARVTLGG